MKKLFTLMAIISCLTACSSAPKVVEQPYQQQPAVVIIHSSQQPYYAPPSVQYYAIPGKYYQNPALPRY